MINLIKSNTLRLWKCYEEVNKDKPVNQLWKQSSNLMAFLNKISIPKYITTSNSKITVRSWYLNDEQKWFAESLANLMATTDQYPILTEMKLHIESLEKDEKKKKENDIIHGFIYFLQNNPFHLEKRCRDTCQVKQWVSKFTMDDKEIVLPKHRYTDIVTGKSKKRPEIFDEHMIDFGQRVKTRFGIDDIFNSYTSFIKNYTGILKNCNTIDEVKQLVVKKNKTPNLSHIHFFTLRDGVVEEPNTIDESFCIFEKIFEKFSISHPEEMIEIFKQFYDVALFEWKIDEAFLEEPTSKTQAEELMNVLTFLFHGVNRLIRKYTPKLIPVIRERDVGEIKSFKRKLLNFILSDL